VTLAGPEERQPRLPAVCRNVQWTTFDPSRPEVTCGDRLKPEMLCVLVGSFRTIWHTDMDMVEPSHSESLL
jgi:hypothetical protein